MGYFLRWIFAFLLLALTFNPTDYNDVRWSMTNFSSELPITVLMGLLLTIGYIIYLRAPLRSIGSFGMFLILAVVAALLWVLYDWGILTLLYLDFAIDVPSPTLAEAGDGTVYGV